MRSEAGFTLVEVLIAMAITAFVAVVGYTGLTTVITGVDSLRQETRQLEELNRAFQVLGRDLHQFVDRSVYDEVGSRLSSMEGGELAAQSLSFSRAGWHNSVGLPRSSLQRVAYYVDEDKFVDGVLPAALGLCVEDGEVLNVDGPGGFSNPSRVTEDHRCSHTRLSEVELEL